MFKIHLIHVTEELLNVKGKKMRRDDTSLRHRRTHLIAELAPATPWGT